MRLISRSPLTVVLDTGETISELTHQSIKEGQWVGDIRVTPGGLPFFGGLVPLERDEGKWQIGAYTITEDGRLLLAGLWDVSGRKRITVGGVTRGTDSMIFQLLVLGRTPWETTKMSVTASLGHNPDFMSPVKWCGLPTGP